MIDHRSDKHDISSCEIKAWKLKNSGLNGIQTYDLRDTGAVLYKLSYLAISELVTLRVCNIPVEGEAPRWLDSSVGRVLHRYRSGDEFESRSGLNFFQALISQLLK